MAMVIVMQPAHATTLVAEYVDQETTGTVIIESAGEFLTGLVVQEEFGEMVNAVDQTT